MSTQICPHNVPAKALCKFTVCLAILAVTAVSDCSAIGGEYQWSGKAGRQGAYNLRLFNGDRSIRLINIRYRGPSDLKLWRSAFLEAAAYCKKENVTFTAGGDGDFFRVNGLSNSNVAIVGWCDDKFNAFGYVVITAVIGDQVYYTRDDGTRRKVGPDPNNFLDWKLGAEPGDWTSRIHFASIQIWKHVDGGNPDAAVCLWLRARSEGSNPYK